MEDYYRSPIFSPATKLGQPPVIQCFEWINSMTNKIYDMKKKNGDKLFILLTPTTIKKMTVLNWPGVLATAADRIKFC